uniref:Uncharacterized protein n=1 Tax=Triticum urartu TaxID=4572 RepID=A0A8R7R3A0_TRIUA
MNPPGSRWRMSPSASSCLSSTRGCSHEGGAPHLRSTRRHRRGPSSRARIQPGFLIAVSGGPRAEDHLTWPMQRRAGRAPFLSRPRPCSSRDTATSSTRHHHPSLPTELASRRRVGVQLIGKGVEPLVQFARDLQIVRLPSYAVQSVWRCARGSSDGALVE